MIYIYHCAVSHQSGYLFSVYHHPPLVFSITLFRQQEKAAQVKGILQMDKWRGIPNKNHATAAVGGLCEGDD